MKFFLLAILPALMAGVNVASSLGGGSPSLDFQYVSVVAKNPRATPTKQIEPEHEHTPNFRQACKCQPANCPPFLNAKSMCQCKSAAAQACYVKTGRGCPKPSANAC